MTTTHIQSPQASFRTGDPTNRRASGLRGWLAVIAGWATSDRIWSTRIALDDMSDAQLGDIGMRRIGRGSRLIDYRDFPRCIDFEYRGVGDDDRSDGRRYA